MTSTYADGAAVEQVIKAAAVALCAGNSALQVSEVIRQIHFDRFLSRIFSKGGEGNWILKGGTGLLARIPNARSTTDIDLFHSSLDLAAALVDLRRMALVDLHDHFYFAFVSQQPLLGGDLQPHNPGYRVHFRYSIGAAEKGTLQIDLVIGPEVQGQIETLRPINRPSNLKLVSFDYQLYPIANQIADKVCACLSTYKSGASSRVHDLVDLVVLATSYQIEADALQVALQDELSRRGLNEVTSVTFPSQWRSRYGTLAKSVPACRRHLNFADACALTDTFLGVLLTGVKARGHWNPVALAWLD